MLKNTLLRDTKIEREREMKLTETINKNYRGTLLFTCILSNFAAFFYMISVVSRALKLRKIPSHRRLVI